MGTEAGNDTRFLCGKPQQEQFDTNMPIQCLEMQAFDGARCPLQGKKQEQIFGQY